MSDIKQLQIPYSEFKSLVIECLKGVGGSFEFTNFCCSVAAIAVKRNLVPDPNPPGHQGLSFRLDRTDQNRVRRVVWDLIIQQVLTIGDYHNDSWPHLSITEYGQKAINSDLPVPNDPDGYLKRIKTKIPNLDPIIETYLIESINTYNINQLLSATITLGCASERALTILIDSYKNSFKEIADKSMFSKKIEGKFIKTQFEEFNKSLEGIIITLPYELKERHKNTLNGVFEMIRQNRNDAGHPTGKQVDKDTLFANLQVFIPYCTHIYDLKTYLETNLH